MTRRRDLPEAVQTWRAFPYVAERVTSLSVKTLKMANMASGMYQQMVVPAPYHFHQPQPQPTPTVTQEPEPKKEPKKRKKPAEKANGEKKKPRIIGQTAYMAGLRLDSGDVGGEQRGECSRCNKKKCFKHADAK